MTKNKFNFTVASIKNISIPKSGTKSYYDSKTTGLMLIVSYGGSKTFYLYKKVRGRPTRIKIGRFPEKKIEKARIAAGEYNSMIADGKNPNEELKKTRNAITFKDLFDLFMERHSKQYKKTWKEDQRYFKQFGSFFSKKKVKDITTDEVRGHLLSIKENNGLHASNRWRSLLSTVFNKGIEYEKCSNNPVSIIRRFTEKGRNIYIQKDNLKSFFYELDNLPDQSMKDLFYLLLYTVARLGKVLSMRWEDISFQEKEWLVKDAKNGKNRFVPLIDESLDILKRRRKTIKSDWVFPSSKSKTGHLISPYRSWHKVRKNAKIEKVRIHDLRRTVLTAVSNNGGSMKDASTIVGHLNVRTTEIYMDRTGESVKTPLEKGIKDIMKYKK